MLGISYLLTYVINSQFLSEWCTQLSMKNGVISHYYIFYFNKSSKRFSVTDDRRELIFHWLYMEVESNFLDLYHTTYSILFIHIIQTKTVSLLSFCRITFSHQKNIFFLMPAFNSNRSLRLLEIVILTDGVRVKNGILT